MITTTTPSQCRACDECGTSAPYEPIIIGTTDFMAGLPFHCDECAAGVARREQAERERREEAHRYAHFAAVVPVRYRESDIGHPYFPGHIWNSLKSLPLSRCIGLIGPAGLGKTRMLALLAKRSSLAGRKIAWIGSNGFQSAAQREFDEREGAESRALLRKLKQAEILFFDDLGKGRLTDTVEAAFFDLLETRSANKLVTHWSANPRPDEDLTIGHITRDAGGILSRAMDSTGQAASRARWEPIISRLIEDTLLVPVIPTASTK